MRFAILIATSLSFAGCESSGPSWPSSCCMVCRTGKPCGDACIPSTSACSKPPGCACSEAQASADDPPDACVDPCAPAECTGWGQGFVSCELACADRALVGGVSSPGPLCDDCPAEWLTAWEDRVGCCIVLGTEDTQRQVMWHQCSGPIESCADR